jgi:hypothetical protein
MYPTKKSFIFEYAHDVAQRKVYGKLLEGEDPLGRSRVAVYEDKDCTINADINK